MSDDSEILRVHLPSLIHRIGSKWVKISQLIAQENECQLKRVRRSRNWQITGKASNVNCCLNQLKSNYSIETHYLIKKLESNLVAADFIDETPQQMLVRLVIEKPTITLSELMELTNCSLLEARQARFQADIF
ncbi:ribosome recycling factor family protein [Vibrio sp. MA40-2]|uniref:ribosome recycling factor family protein n=1 Tax=Vibrio sp. MA40-2 TaxID=3391828 RepID=UPI0039A52714